MERIRTRGMFFLEGERKFFVRGVSYGPFRENPLGEPFPDKRVAETDLELLREMGANAVRIYHVPPPWLGELCHAFGLRLIVGVPWQQHIRFLDSSRTRQEIRARVREGAQALRGTRCVLATLVGNEIPPQVVRWYGKRRVEHFISELADEVRQVDPECLVSYASFPMTEYLELPDLDFCSFNVYLHREAELRRYLARLQNLAGFRPLVITEFGIDSIREGEQAQAEILPRTLRSIAELGCGGGVAFSFTDEWHTGGFEIEDWAFGLVSRDRTPKPAFGALADVFRSALPEVPARAPRVSVVVCAYNAERTMEECLDSLRELRYPDFEVVIVDDGSTDRTREISEGYPEFRLISHENRGLSAARNDGILAATGEVVAFTDSDCAVDPDWLTFLVHRLRSEEFAGVGGPNLPPAEDDWIPEVVARCPGGPTHVLLTDHEAEHIPGCNMAFWRRHLLEVGLFDPEFRTAGDDVDICWRLQSAGHRLGYAAGALVWHRRRHTVGAYLKQQRGYGRAEAQLYFKHPYRFNFLGQSRWLGRIYSDLGPGILATRPRIYGGAFGSGLFQTLYEPPSSLWRHLPATLEWNLSALLLTLTGLAMLAAGVSASALVVAGPVLLAISVSHAGHTACRLDVRDLPPLGSRLLVGVLTYLGPLVRSVARARLHLLELPRPERIHFPRLAPRPPVRELLRGFVLSYWNETGIEKEECLSALLDFLRPRRYPIVLDNGWEPWDLAVHQGLWVRGEVNLLVENHGEQRRQVDVRLRLRPTSLAWLALGSWCLGLALCVAAAAGSAALTCMAGLVGMGAFVALRKLRLARTLYDSVEITFRRLPLDPLEHEESGPLPRS